ncbi:MAG: glycosyltransferase family 4 protein [bacterium]
MSTAVHLVTKPLSPPWNDSAVNLPKYLVEYSSRTAFHILTDTNKENEILPNSDRVIVDGIYHSSNSLHLGFLNKSRLFAYLLSRLHVTKRGKNKQIFHFFYTPNTLTSLTVSLLLWRQKNTRLIHTVTSCPNLKQKRKASSLFIRNTEVIALSDHTRRIIESVLDKPVTRIYPGIPLPEMPTRTDIEAAREAEGFEAGSVYLIYPGDLYFGEAMPFWRAALPAWRARFPQVRLVITCRTKHSLDKPCRDEIIRLGGDRVVFRDDIADLNRLFTAGDIIVFPVKSLYGKMDFPLALLEATALGKPAVVSSFGSLQELADFGGVLGADPDRPDGFTEAIDQLITSPEKRHEVGMQGAQVVKKHFSAEKMAEAYEKIYHG